MRILFVCNEYPPVPHGGIGVFVKTLAEALVQEGHTIAVIGYDPTVHQHITTHENGVEVFRLNQKNYPALKIGRFSLSLAPILSRYNLSSEIEKVISVFKPDLMESFDWSGPLWKKPSVPLVVRMHGANTAYQLYESKPFNKLVAHFEKNNIKFADALCAVSHHIGQLTLNALHHSYKEFNCIYNFTDTKIFKPIDQIIRDPLKLIYIGRIDPRKGLSELFHILNELFKINRNTYLELVGSYRDEYKKELMDILPADQQERVRFLGKIPHEELPPLINSARLFIMPSRAEAFGLTAIEAMACGTAVLLTDRASGPEIVEEAKTGWLLDITDFEAAALKIDQLLSQPILLDQIAGKGRDRILQKFSKEAVLEQNIIFYKRLMA